MTYPTGTPVQTFLLDTEDQTNVVPSIVLVVRDTDTGEIRLVQVNGDHIDAQRMVEKYNDTGDHVLMVIEGEQDLGFGTASVWPRRH